MGSQNRQSYLTATTLDQDFLDKAHDALENKLEMICEIETPTGTIYASDRNKYVGSTFYEALLNFPVITRTVGEWLAPDLQFSTLTLELSNVDGRFNNFLPSGVDYDSFINRAVTVKLGLNEQAGTYKTIFKGKITEVGGFKRSVKSITIIARDDYDKFSVTFPNQALTRTAYPDLEDKNVGVILPVIYGDFTTALEPSPAIVPAFVTNGNNANVIAGTNNLQLRISLNTLSVFDTAKVYLKRGDTYFLVPSGDVVNVSVDKTTFEIDQNTGNLWVVDNNGTNIAYIYDQSDAFYVHVKGKDLGSYDDNLVSQAKDILLSYGGAVSGDFDANWDTFRDKNSPSESNISGFKSRVWVQEPQPVMTYVLSMLEQVRLEAFIDRDLQIKISSLHLDNFDATPDFKVKNWDVVKGSFQPKLDERNVFNRAQAAYDFHPDKNENARSSAIFKNAAAITQVGGKQISKKIVFPNLYEETAVVYQLKEILKIASSGLETVDLALTWRAMLLDIGDFILIDINIGGTIFQNVPLLIRTIGYDPDGLKIPISGWSTQLLPFTGYTPSYAGTVGGASATITQE